MPFAISKLMMLILLPPASLIIIFALGLLVMKKYHRAGTTMLWLGIAFLYVLSIEPTSNGMMNRLEREYPPFTPSGKRPDAIVVLSGGVKDLSWNGLDDAPAETSLARTVAAVALYRAYGGITLLLTGGSGDPGKPGHSEAKAMAGTAAGLGVSKGHILVDSASRNTLESAAEAARMLKKKRIILVTSAYHMRRSVLMFEKQGFTVTPAPAAYLSEQAPVTEWSFMPKMYCFSLSVTALQERFSRTWYSMRGAM